jgi:hypothetical protein
MLEKRKAPAGSTTALGVDAVPSGVPLAASDSSILLRSAGGVSVDRSNAIEPVSLSPGTR